MFWFDSRGTPHTEQLHTIERWTRTNYGTLVLELTLDDPGTFSRPVTLKLTARVLPPGEELMEYICTENNQYGMDVVNANRVVTNWNLELGSPKSVLRRGWTRNDIEPGEKISFKGFGGRTVLIRAVADSITPADGRSFSGASGAPDTGAR